MHSWGIETTGVELVPSVPTFFAEFHPDAARRALLAAGARGRGRRTPLPRPHRRAVRRGRSSIRRRPSKPLDRASSTRASSTTPSGRAWRRTGSCRPGCRAASRAWWTAFVLALRDVFPHVRAFPSVEGWGIHLLASGQPIARRTAAELAALMPAAAQEDLVAWGPHPTAVEQLDAVTAAGTAVDWAGAGPEGQARSRDDRPINEYFLVRRPLHGEGDRRGLRSALRGHVIG